MQAVAKAERETAAREEENCGQQTARRAELHSLAVSFEAAVGKIIENVSSASTELENSAVILNKSSAATQQLSTVVATASTGGDPAMCNRSPPRRRKWPVPLMRSDGRWRISTGSPTRRSIRRIRPMHGSSSCRSLRIASATSPQLITTIAEQTNLLALNATIEKPPVPAMPDGVLQWWRRRSRHLRRRPPRQLARLPRKLRECRRQRKILVVAIKEISGTIGRVSEIAAAIAAAVEEQGAATQDIARNVQQAAIGSTQVATSIADVNRSAWRIPAHRVRRRLRLSGCKPLFRRE